MRAPQLQVLAILLAVVSQATQATGPEEQRRGQYYAIEALNQSSLVAPEKALLPSVCFPPSPLPTAPDKYSTSSTFTGHWGTTDTFTGRFWRQPCSPGSTKTYLYLRVTPTAGTPFICGPSFAVVQGGVQHSNIKLTQTYNGTSFCGDVFVPTTFLVAQWDAPFLDRNQSLTLYFSGVFSNASASIAAYTDGVALTDVEEFYHSGMDHYFITANPLEIAALEGGAFGGVWYTTFRGFQGFPTPARDSQPVCRFFSAAFAPKSSHFYTASQVECDALKSNTDWTYEGIAFYTHLPSPTGACPTGTERVFRLYNNGKSGAPNHRFTTDLNLRAQFVNELGWTAEGYGSDGVVFCAGK